jgi:ABC-type branched-subunit amino acid transport system substrate-binding protein
VIGAAAVALMLSACSSSAKSGGQGASGQGASLPAGSSGSAGKQATGSPIKLGIAVPIKATVDFSDAVAAAKGAARAVNAAGGVNGHPIDIVSCNTGLDPNKEQACARQLVSDKVAATVGSANYTAEKAVDDLMRNAGIPQLGDTPAGISETDPNSYLFWGGQSYANAAQTYGAQKWGGAKVAEVRLDYPWTAPYPAQYKKQCAQLGCRIVSEAVIPSNNATDLSPQAAQLVRGNPDILVPNLGPLQAPLLTAMNHLGYKGKIISQDSAVTAKNFFAQPTSVQDQNILITPFPPPFAQDKFPAMKQYVTEMQAEKAAGDGDAPSNFNYSNAVTTSAWMAVHVFAQVAAAAKAYDAASFKKAINSTKGVDLLGLGTWNPTNVLFDKLPRASLDTWYFYTFVNGQPKVLNDTPVAVTDLVKAAFA